MRPLTPTYEPIAPPLRGTVAAIAAVVLASAVVVSIDGLALWYGARAEALAKAPVTTLASAPR